MGFWATLHEVYDKNRVQRFWVQNAATVRQEEMAQTRRPELAARNHPRGRIQRRHPARNESRLITRSPTFGHSSDSLLQRASGSLPLQGKVGVSATPRLAPKRAPSSDVSCSPVAPAASSHWRGCATCLQSCPDAPKMPISCPSSSTMPPPPEPSHARSIIKTTVNVPSNARLVAWDRLNAHKSRAVAQALLRQPRNSSALDSCRPGSRRAWSELERHNQRSVWS